jgi:serine/threonine protein kinase
LDIVSKISNPLDIYGFIREERMSWVPYSQIKILEKIAKGGFGTVYKAFYQNEIVALKRFSNSQYISKYLLNEVMLIIET